MALAVPLLLVLLGLLLLALRLLRDGRSRPPHFPPGPFRWPIYGNHLQILAKNYKYTFKGLVEMSADFKSPILGLFLGPHPTLVTNDYASTRELLLKPEFQGRPDIFVARLRSFGKLLGVFFVDGPMWAEQRRFSLRHMRDFGFGRRFPRLEEAAMVEVRDMIDILRSPSSPSDKAVVRGRQALVPDLFFAGFTNTILEVLVGERVPRERHESLREVTRAILLFQRHVEPSGGVLNITPWIRHVLPDGSGYRGLVQGHEELLDMVKGIIEEQKTSFDDSAIRGFIDRFLLKMKEKSDESSDFTDEQLVMIVLDYMFPSATVTTVTLVTALLYMMRHPDKADRAHEEIVGVVGRGRLPELDDRPRLPYTEAFLREVLRIESSTTLSITHRCTEDTWFRGYFIPKNTVLIPNLWAANRDPSVWERGEEFEPERFLDPSTGSLRCQDRSMPFGLGKRLCAGETFSRQNLFIFLAALMQNFRFSMPEGQPIPANEDFVPGVIVRPESFWVNVDERP